VTEPVAVPWDPAAFDTAVLSGTTLRDAAPRSPARLAIRALALERLSPVPPSARPRRVPALLPVRRARNRATSLER
jgi:hypothetical protein